MTLALLAAVPATTSNAQPKPACELTNPDSSIDGIRLGDGASAQQRLGKSESLKLTLPSPTSSFPWAVFFSRDGRQTLALQYYPGGGIDDVFMAEVIFAGRKPGSTLSNLESGYIGKAPRSQTLPVRDFVSGHGIRLGLRKAEVLARLGACFEVFRRKGARETIRHEMVEAADEARTPAFLKRTKMPLYLAEYEFAAGRLVRFRFGFPYP